jgi:hypothetical protein
MSKEALIIDLFPPMIRCSIAGKDDFQKFGIPVDSESAEIVDNDFEGDWGGIPVCEQCYVNLPTTLKGRALHPLP